MKEKKKRKGFAKVHTPPQSVNADKNQLPLNMGGCISSSSLSNQSLDRIPESANKAAN